jgi:tRNA nucleotidyltransferase/poly(A) polymerase
MIKDQVVGFGCTSEQAHHLAKRNRPKENFTLRFVSREMQAAAAAARHPLIRTVFEIVGTIPAAVFLVGGSVRDLLRGTTAHDLDFAIDGDGLHVARRVANALDGAYVALDSERRTGRVVLPSGHPLTSPSSTQHLDFATLRGATLKADLCDRDFTINAMALAPGPGDDLHLVDPLNGAHDLEHRVLRATSQTAFISDPVRTLRAVRMQIQFDLEVEPQTEDWLRQAVPLLDRVSAERIRDEWFKILDQPQASRALQVLDQLTLLARIAPPLAKAEQETLDHAIATVWAVEHLWQAFLDRRSHSIAPLDADLLALAPQVRQRFESLLCDNRRHRAWIKCAALLHHLGPPPNAAHLAEQLAQSWHCSRAEAKMLRQTILYHDRPAKLVQQLPLSRRAIYAFYRDADTFGIDAAFIALACYLSTWDGAPPAVAWRQQIEVVRDLWDAYWHHRETQIAPPLLLSGHDLIALGIQPGPEIGQLLERLRQEQAAGEIDTRQQALAHVRQWSSIQ